jgi:stage II sporulation protein R
MKNLCITLIFIFIITLTVAADGLSQKPSDEYLRIHIRANSNESIDQNIKYQVKDCLVKYLTPFIADCKSKRQAELLLKEKEEYLENTVDNLLKSNGFSYRSNIVVRSELFPTRVYEDFTLEEGFYDAVIVELGKAEGDNWWCVVYPPLCFTGNESGIVYKSKILEIIKDFKNKHA